MTTENTAPNKPTSVTADIMAQCDKHLVIVHRPGQQSINDWRQVALHVRRIDPKIGVFVVSAQDEDGTIMRAAAKKPTLVLSLSGLGTVAPLRGKVYQGRAISKFRQLQVLAAAGVPVPGTQVLQPGIQLDPQKWGPFVVVKPLDMASSSKGLGIQLMRTQRVRYLMPNEYPEDHPGRLGPMVAQQFIDTGPFFSNYRVLSLFGTPLYCMHVQSSIERASLNAEDDTVERSVIAIQQDERRKRSFVYSADAVALAHAAHNAFPDVPLLGVDVIRDARTGNFFVLEVNPGGNTWHFSSRHHAEARRAEGPDYVRQFYEQLDAMATAAHVLADVTRREAA